MALILLTNLSINLIDIDKFIDKFIKTDRLCKEEHCGVVYKINCESSYVGQTKRKLKN